MSAVADLADSSGQELKFSIQGKPSFELPLSAVANSNIAGKNEVALEFNPPPPPQTDSKDLSKRPPDDLVEMRFYVPGLSILPKGSDAGSDAEDEVEEDEDGNEISAAEAMHNKIKEKADIGTDVGTSIVIFEDALILTPRYVLIFSLKRLFAYSDQRTILARFLQRLDTTYWQIDRLPSSIHINTSNLPPSQTRRPTCSARPRPRSSYSSRSHEIPFPGGTMAKGRGD
jgi:structure-specific recognition protein 1